jgi:hypothetical protein
MAKRLEGVERRMGIDQTTLSAFSDPDHFRESLEKLPVYDCQNCTHFRGFVPGPKVRCIDQHKEIPKTGCSCWSDGNELAFIASIAPPAGWQAKKYAGGRA